MCAHRRLPSNLVRRVLVALSALMVCVLASGAVEAGARYYYCAAMDRAQAEPCCPPSARPDNGRVVPHATLARPDCCQARMRPALPEGVSAEMPAPLSSPLVAVLPAVAFSAPRAVRPPPTRGGFAWSLPPPLSASETRARLMVFLS